MASPAPHLATDAVPQKCNGGHMMKTYVIQNFLVATLKKEVKLILKIV